MNWLDDFYLIQIKKNRVALVRDILPDPICDHLLAEDVISQEEYEMIMYCNQTTAGRNRRLLDILSTKGPNGYNEFRSVLVKDFPWLAHLLDSTPKPSTEDQQIKVESKHTICPDQSYVTDTDVEEVVRSLLTTGSLMSWKFLARKLGLTEDKINEIEYRSLRDIRAQIYEMLFYWRSENSYRATVDSLCSALRDEGRIATAAAVQDMEETEKKQKKFVGLTLGKQSRLAGVTPRSVVTADGRRWLFSSEFPP